MDLNWLRDLIELETSGSFSKAAGNRNVSVSTLSRHVQLLEDWASQPLIDRSSHPVQLTAAGTKLLPVAKSVVRELDFVAAQLRNRKDTQKPVTFLAPNAVSVAVFPRLLGSLQASFGAFAINLIPDNFLEVLHRFREGEADFALYYECDEYAPRVSMGQYETMLIARDALLPVARDEASARGSRRDVLRTALLGEMSHLGQIARNFMMRHHIEYEARITGSQVLAIRQLALEGAGLAWLPASLVNDDIAARRLVRLLPEVSPILLTIQVARRPAQEGSTAAQIWRGLHELGDGGGPMLDFLPAGPR